VHNNITRQAPRERRPRSALRVVRALWRRLVGVCACCASEPFCAAFDSKLSSKACPQGFSQVTTEAACQSLAAIGGKAYVGSVNIASFPAGCLWLIVGGGVYLNNHSTGAAHPNAQPLCAGARRRAQPRTPLREARRIAHPSPHTHASCDGACRRAVAAALRIVAVANPPL
jgi:hypothetical protein